MQHRFATLMWVWGLALSVLLTASPSTLHAQVVLQDIRTVGAERIEDATIRSYLTVAPGQPVTQDDLDASLTSLFRSGLFSDVVLAVEGNSLVVRVVENPIINQIAFEGNRRISDSALAAEIELRPRVVYTQPRVQSDVQRIQEVYRRSGRFAASVEPVIIERDQNRVDLVFEINEGATTRIRSINFVGNRAFSDWRLRDEIASQESSFFNFFSGGADTYDPDRVAFDRELLRRFYLSQGYADFRVVSAVAELTPTQEDFIVTFTVEEGERYRFGEIDVVSQIPELDPEILRDEIVSYSGDVYSNLPVEESISGLTRAAQDLQYAFVEINPLVSRNRDERLINVTYQIEEGPRVFVERIEIVGNVRTVDEVIRREMELVEGDPFSVTLLRRSEQRIRNLGFFQTVDVEAVQGSAPDRTLIQVAVAERSTGELMLGAGYSTADGVIGDVSLRERNLLGRGQDLRLSFALSGESSQFDLSFTEPYFLGRDLSAGVDLFHVTRERSDTGGFNQTTSGFGLRFGYVLAPYLRQTLSYRLTHEDISDISPTSTTLIEEGSALISQVGQSLVYDRLDSRIDPTDGYILRFSTNVAGLGGDVKYGQATVSGSYFTPLFGSDDLVLQLSAEAGIIDGIGQDVRIQDRFFVGGGNLRGFARGGIGPRTLQGNALGGNQYATATAEVSFPLGLPDELGIRGRAFADAGILRDVDVDPNVTPYLEEDTVRASLGVGLSWASPFGPIRLDYGVPVVEEEFDRTENFRFSFGTRF